ncbi:MAG: lysophospholipid acyltransferase family protein [Gemmataceae bacterium]
MSRRHIPPYPTQIPDRTRYAADRLLAPLAVAAAAGFCAAVWAPDGRFLARLVAYLGAALVGLTVPRLAHPYRGLGLTSLGATLSAATAAVVAALGDWPVWAGGVFALGVGLATGAILRFRDRRRAALRHFYGWAVAGAVLGVGLVVGFNVAGQPDDWRRPLTWLAVAAAATAAGLAWTTLLRPALELGAATMMRSLYRLRAAGPGLAAVPADGPVLVMANHADWFDPLLVAGVLPRPVTPLMTASFFDLPGLRPILWHVFRTIRVPEIPIKRDAPEVREAVNALDVGRVVVIFPEGYLRRSEDRPLRRFGQGVWQILQARPDTPVIACWVEGTWGSFFSHFNGPPTRNKRFHLRRPVRVGVLEPRTVPAEVLGDPLRARAFLANWVLEARRPLGLPDLPPVTVGQQDEDAEDADNAAVASDKPDRG